LLGSSEEGGGKKRRIAVHVHVLVIVKGRRDARQIEAGIVLIWVRRCRWQIYGILMSE